MYIYIYINVFVCTSLSWPHQCEGLHIIIIDCVCKRLIFRICLQGYLWVYRKNSARGREREGYLVI